MNLNFGERAFQNACSTPVLFFEMPCNFFHSFRVKLVDTCQVSQGEKIRAGF
jgi:hypothetical protein